MCQSFEPSQYFTIRIIKKKLELTELWHAWEGTENHTDFWLGKLKQIACNLYAEWTGSITDRDNIWFTIYSDLRPPVPLRPTPPLHTRKFRNSLLKRPWPFPFTSSPIRYSLLCYNAA
jgi:hypothetical protein